jgi:UDP-glucose 4-epimerase
MKIMSERPQETQKGKLTKLTGKKVLVTGGAGFIGSHLVDALVPVNQVTVVDDLSSGKRDHIRHHLEQERIRFIEADIRDLELMRQLASDNEIIFHLAVQGLRLSLYDPHLVHEVNSTGTLNLCQAALEAGVERFVYISSSEVYGTGQTVPMSEDHLLEPTTPYGASKLAGEAYARSYNLSFDLPVTIVRPFNSYGPREHLEGVYGEVIPRFVLRAMNSLPPIIFGDGEQTRDFTDVRDTVKGIILAAESGTSIGETINIAAGKEVSINEVAEIIGKLLGRDDQLKPIHTDPRPGDVRRHYADITKAEQMLNFKPEIGIVEGIQYYIDWVRDQGWDLENLQRQELIINWRR